MLTPLLALFVTSLVPIAVGGSRAGATPAPAPHQTRILLIGDSVMDQQGGAAAFELRQAGFDAKTIGLWGSGLLTKDQYDHGKTNLDGGWLARARHEIDTFDPDLVAVYMNHNYWNPHPTDAFGRPIDDLSSRAGQLMIRTQADALITILRARNARVFFVAPVPVMSVGDPDPIVWNPIWRGYAPVLAARHVGIIDSGAVLRGPTGMRAQTEPDCTGTPRDVRPPGDIHLTRLGAGIAGSSLAVALANTMHVSLRGNGAPGDRTAALVPNPVGTGYWLVGCEGSVYAFGDARHLPGGRGLVAGHHGVVAAAATSTGEGMWLVAADGTVAAVGDARPIVFASARHLGAVVDAAATSDDAGLWSVAATGAVATTGDAHLYGSMAGHHLNGAALGIVPTRDNKGYWLLGSDGGIFAFGDARFYGSMGATKLNGPIVALATTPDDRGYWLLGSDGGIFAFGDARYEGNALWIAPPYPVSIVMAAPGPATKIVAVRGVREGYWTLNDNGRVVNHGVAVGHAGDNNLALFTP